MSDLEAMVEQLKKQLEDSKQKQGVELSLVNEDKTLREQELSKLKL